uniref:Molybdenum cofactor biosynthesis protein B n=1 Tax=Eiseniibacteriota bacterium TaxID=2212470 RepID=A0A832HZU5_UNCEI
MSRGRRPARAGRAAAPRRASSVRGGAHAARRPGERPVVVAILTVSDTRRGADDLGGAAAERAVRAAGHAVAMRGWTRDDVAAIRRAVRAMLARPDVDAVLVTGGTGAAARDVTPEAVAPLVDKPLPGFGEAFRAASWRQVGAAAWLSRAAAGVARGRLLVTLPGAPRAVKLALTEVLLPELAHVARMLGRFDTEE